MSVKFLGDNTTTVQLGPAVKDIKFVYESGDSVIAEGSKANLHGDADEAYVTYNNGTIKRFQVTTGYVFKKSASATVQFSIAQTTISVISEAGLGAELKLVV
ncbi:hypothetical protein FVEN_g1133 [Fusarium venenatum]|uniref:Uncharacterized protein n=1 Tax=Fusarium venenatum TaxID=56646 RepID=A0A2L2U4Y0_9HYPO|nr:uncharacterized protein FVRRES_10432 [Fusarium venenatum]KAG8361234.1 hypothetical protein FVEN_g1133 [Fusarium venenatum]KAH6967035.1 hypothetical protein EDB82DRAFT_530721 [Fusarium venenatum]CEI70355.1 unnamed protein product [Fusarium venenatum]